MDLRVEYINAKRRLFHKYYEARLNPMQREAVFSINGPLLVLAGAGSGKTTVLVNRISYLIKYGNAYFDESMPDYISEETVEALKDAANLSAEEIEEILAGFVCEPCPPWRVLAITFTNKAAREIKERLARAFEDGTVNDSVWAGTFHSVCVRILRKYGDRLGYREGFSIYDTDDKKRLLTSCMKDLKIDEKSLSVKTVANAISMSKDNLRGIDEFETSRDPRSQDIKRIFELYQKKLMEYNALDFDDIIMKTVELLSADSEVRGYYQEKFKFVLVDEYQDTNYAQFVLTKLLSDKHRNIMVVGDDDQSIYKFRGATVENILGFDKTYPDAKVVKLEQNYRSTANILDAANSVISHNEARHEKKLWSDKPSGEKITLKEASDQNEEALFIIDRIRAGVNNFGRKYSDYAILYRVNELARNLETAFAKSGLPYKILGGMRFYDRKEIKDMIAYLSLVNSKSDNLRLKRIINEPKRKIGAATVSAVEQIAAIEGVSMFRIMETAGEYAALSKSAEKLSGFCRFINEVGETYNLPSDILKAFFEKSGYREMLKAEGFEGEGKIDNVNEFIAGALEYEKRCEENGEEATLPSFLEEITLVSDVDKYDENSDAVVLMTIHSAKGLEFPVVFLAGMEDGIFPSLQNMISENEMSEERRLCYVAITRAKEKLYITYAKNRLMYGRTSYNTLSGFVRCELPETLIDRVGQRGASKFGYSSVGAGSGARGFTYQPVSKNSELKRAPDLSSGAGSAVRYGVKKLEEGTRVSHSKFGEGVILSARDLSGDILYEVDFKNGGRKKLMATYARLTPID